MTPKEQLKIYAAYLPYRLKIKAKGRIWQLTDIKVIDEYPLWACNVWNEEKLKYEPKINVKESGQLGHGFLFEECKPILYDLSFLTKEIEHEGRVFVPILEICDYLGFVYTEYTLNDNSVDLILNKLHHRANMKTGEPRKVRLWFSNHKGISFYCTNMALLIYKDLYGAIQELLKWHINVFDIPKSQFINK